MIGRVINNYEIKSVVAEGGMGKVYLAEHPFMGRRAAIKILRGMYLEDKAMVTRFVNEARAANAINHPNIVEIIDVGYLPDGPPYLMMEFLEGETLGMRMARVGRLSPAETVRILDQAASALEAAHAAGIVHRDLKPDNLFLVPDTGGNAGAERVKVVDFGIAKLEGPGMGESVRTTGLVLGTPNYMSPEQCRGTGLDHRTDIYALGAILYQALCGKPPFVGEAQIDVMMMHVVKIPTAPRELFPDVPEHLEQIALRALAKRPEDRYASMSELRTALAAQTYSTGTSGSSQPAGERVVVESAARQPSVYPQPRKRWIWVSLAIAVGIAVGWVGAWRLRGDGGQRLSNTASSPSLDPVAPAAPTAKAAAPAPTAPASAPALPAAPPVGATPPRVIPPPASDNKATGEAIAAGDQSAQRLRPARSTAVRRKKSGRARAAGEGNDRSPSSRGGSDDAPLPLRSEPSRDDGGGEASKKGMNKW